jgi:hypothetical protein
MPSDRDRIRRDFVGPFRLAERRLIAFRPDLADEVAPGLLTPRPVEVVRVEDFVHLTFSFVNLKFTAGKGAGAPLLSRRTANRPAFLIVDCSSQHLSERALFEGADGYEVTAPPRPHDIPDAQWPPKDPDLGKKGATSSDPLVSPPLFASLAGPSRLVFKVTTQTIDFTTDGLLAAMSQLDLNVAPQAVPPRTPFGFSLADALAQGSVSIAALVAGETPRRKGSRTRALGSPAEETRIAAELTALGRLRATSGALAYRFGAQAALRAADSSSLGKRLRLGEVIGDIGQTVRIPRLPPLPSAPEDTQTALELPWRLLVSPNEFGSFAHSRQIVEHNGRYELWHTRLGVRARGKDGKPVLDDDGNPTVDERAAELRTIRALWARDYNILPDVLDRPELAFTSPPDRTNFPNADGTDDRPKERMSLNSRDRMMLVHETSNFHLTRQRRAWIPEAVPTERLLLSGLGGWLHSRVMFPTLPDGGLTIEEWKHRAALGRDHEVKVVYAGFLLPFGHKASLVKVTERKFADAAGGGPAYLFQRLFIIVREPERQFRTDTRKVDSGRLDLVMPFGTVRILTRVTPPLDPPANLTGGGMLFEPHVLGAPFMFKLVAVDIENNIVEFSAPLVFMERDHNVPGGEFSLYNTSGSVDREFSLGGQRVAFAESERPDDTVLATSTVTFKVETADFLAARPQDEPRFEPTLEEAKAAVPAMSVLAGAASPTRLAYPNHYATNGFTGNAAQVFLEALDAPSFSFAGQGDRSGGFVTPSLNVQGLSRLTGPVGGDLEKAIADPGGYDVGQVFAGISAKLFGLIPLSELFGALGFSPDRVPKFVAQALDAATTLKQNVERIRNAADANAAEIGAEAAALKAAADALLADLVALASDPANPPALKNDLTALAGKLGPFSTAVDGAAGLPQAIKQQLAAVTQLVVDQLQDVDLVIEWLIAFAQGKKVPDVVHARIDWSTELDPWPSAGDGAIFKPRDPQARISLAVEIQAPTTQNKPPSALVACSLSPFDLRLIGAATFIALRFDAFEFTIAPGKKPDVNVRLSESDGIRFEGPLEFVNTLKDIIPFDGFSDPPYLDVTAEGVKAGFDLAIPDLAVGVFALTNVSLGANLKVPFVDESIETTFNFSTRENPFRLQVSLFAGGGFFGITITPDRVRVLEAAFEFGAAISVNLGVASGGVSVMAGIYFRLETSTSGDDNAQLTGYFRMRGEVDVLGLISACIELYLSLTYETSTHKAAGRATLTIEVEVMFLSFDVSISCEKKFAGSGPDPTFVDLMGLPASAPPDAEPPWDLYCRAFADD